MAKAATSSSAAATATNHPVARAVCDCLGCGAPATGTMEGDPSIDHFDEFEKPEDAHTSGFDRTNTNGGPRKLPKHEYAHGALNHCWNHRVWIGTRDARIVAAQKGV